MTNLLIPFLILFAASGGGRLLLTLLRIDINLPTDEGEAATANQCWCLAVEACMGLVAGGTVLMLTGMIALPPDWFLCILLLFFAFFAYPRILTLLTSLTSLTEARSPLGILCLLVVSPVLVVLLMTTALPELEIDEITYHLTVPKAWHNEGKIIHFPFEPHSNWHALSATSYLCVFILKPDAIIAAKLMEIARCILAALAAFGLLSWLSHRSVGLLGAALILMGEEVLRLGTTAHTDAGQMLYLISGVGVLALWLHRIALDGADTQGWQRTGLLLLGTALVGAVAAVKQTGYFTVIMLMVALGLVRIMAMQRHEGRDWFLVIRDGCLASLGVLLALTPWWLKNGLLTGNPFFPFLGAWFPPNAEAAVGMIHITGYYPSVDKPVLSDLLPDLKKIYVLQSNLRLTSVYGLLFLGPFALLLWMLNNRAGIGGAMRLPRLLLALLAMLIVITYLYTPFPRFFIAAWVVAWIAVLGEGWHFLRRRRELFLAWWGGFLLLGVFAFTFWDFAFQFQYQSKRLGVWPDAPLLSEESREKYYRSVENDYDLLASTEKHVGPEGRLLVSMASQVVPLISVRFYPNAPCIALEATRTMSKLGWSTEQMAQFLEGMGVTHVLMRPEGPDVPWHDFNARHLRDIDSSANYPGDPFGTSWVLCEFVADEQVTAVRGRGTF